MRACCVTDDHDRHSAIRKEDLPHWWMWMYTWDWKLWRETVWLTQLLWLWYRRSWPRPQQLNIYINHFTYSGGIGRACATDYQHTRKMDESTHCPARELRGSIHEMCVGRERSDSAGRAVQQGGVRKPDLAPRSFPTQLFAVQRPGKLRSKPHYGQRYSKQNNLGGELGKREMQNDRSAASLHLCQGQEQTDPCKNQAVSCLFNPKS